MQGSDRFFAVWILVVLIQVTEKAGAGHQLNEIVFRHVVCMTCFIRNIQGIDRAASIIAFASTNQTVRTWLASLEIHADDRGIPCAQIRIDRIEQSVFLRHGQLREVHIYAGILCAYAIDVKCVGQIARQPFEIADAIDHDAIGDFFLTGNDSFGFENDLCSRRTAVIGFFPGNVRYRQLRL